jgi:hypothetical protein
MSIYNEFATDAGLESRGFEFEWIGRNGKPVFKCRLARPGGGNKEYESVRERVMAPFRRAKSLSPEVQAKASRDVFAQACVVPGSWFSYINDEWVEGIQDHQADGTDPVVPATPDTISRILGEQPELFLHLVNEATDVENYRIEGLEEDSKN